MIRVSWKTVGLAMDSWPADIVLDDEDQLIEERAGWRRISMEQLDQAQEEKTREESPRHKSPKSM